MPFLPQINLGVILSHGQNNLHGGCFFIEITLNMHINIEKKILTIFFLFNIAGYGSPGPDHLLQAQHGRALSLT